MRLPREHATGLRGWGWSLLNNKAEERERGVNQTNETRDQARRLEPGFQPPGNAPRVPGKEAEMKGKRSWGKTGRENRTRLFAARTAALPQETQRRPRRFVH